MMGRSQNKSTQPIFSGLSQHTKSRKLTTERDPDDNENTVTSTCTPTSIKRSCLVVLRLSIGLVESSHLLVQKCPMTYTSSEPKNLELDPEF